MFPKMGVPQNGWFIMENPIKMDDLRGPPLYLETPTYLWNHIQPLEDHPGVCVGGPGLFRVNVFQDMTKTSNGLMP